MQRPPLTTLREALRGVVATVRFRLTFWHVVLLACVAAILFLLGTSLLRHQLNMRTDDGLLADVRQFEALYDTFGLQALQDEFRREAESAGSENVGLVLMSPRGIILAASEPDAWQDLAGGLPWEEGMLPGDVRMYSTRLGPADEPVRVADACIQDRNRLRIGRSLAPDSAVLRAYRRVFALLVAAMFLFGVVLAWWLTDRAMRGVEQVTRTARRIGNDELGARVPVGRRGREIRELVDAFNEMLDRIDRLVAELRHVTESLAHDIRSPLTRIRSAAEAALASRATGAAVDTCATVIEECDRLTQMANTMLEIAKANAGVADLALEAIDVADILAEVQDLFLPVAEDRAVTLRFEVPGEPVYVRADLRRCQRAVANIVDNGIKFTPPGGRVVLSCRAVSGGAEITVSDTGIGLSDADRARVFERFFRAEASRSAPGNGLGLSLAQAIVNAHRGDLTVRSVPGKGSCFTLRLPNDPARPARP